MTFSRRPGHRFNRGRIATAVAASAPAAVTPVTIYGANCTKWWRSDLGNTIAVDGNWVDQVVGYTLAQGVAGARPTVNATGGPNSRPSILFDGTDDCLVGGALARTNPQTIIIVGRNVSWTASDSWINDASATYIILQRTASPQLAMSAGTPGNNTGNPAIGAWRRIQAEFTGSVADRLVSAAAVATGTNTGTTAGTAVLVGRNAAATTFCNFEVCEIIFLDITPSAGQNTATDAYITGLYGAGLTS